MYTVYKYKNVKISSSEQSKWVPLHGGGSSSRSRSRRCRCRYAVWGMWYGGRKKEGERGGREDDGVEVGDG